VKNLDMLITIQKNWPNNGKCDCSLVNNNVEDFLGAKDAFIKEYI
jgi:hypothetical protein